MENHYNIEIPTKYQEINEKGNLGERTTKNMNKEDYVSLKFKDV